MAETTTYPKPAYFQCSLCGECCSSISIPIEAEKAEALLQKDWVQKRLASHQRRLEKVSPAFYRMPLTAEQVCVFLGENKECLIEANEGKALKPDECKTFPFAAIRLEGEILYDASGSCKTVAEELITQFRPIHPQPQLDPEQDLGLTIHPFPKSVRKGPALLTQCWGKSNTLKPEEFRALQGQWSAYFQDDALTPEAALLKTRQLMLRKKVMLGKKVLEPSEAFKSKVWEGWQWLVPLLFLRRPYGMYSFWQELLSLFDGQARYQDPYVFGVIPLSMKATEQVVFPKALEGYQKAFLHNLLQRNVLFAYHHSLTGLLGLACVGLYLVRWYAANFALFRAEEAQPESDELKGVSKPEVTFEDLVMAVRLVERYYTGHQPRFLETFRVGVGQYFWQWAILGKD